MKSTNTLATLALICCFGLLKGQTATFDRVFTLLQSKCASCHGGTAPIAFDLGTTPAQTYAAIVGTTPLNPAAAAKGYKRVDPGHPYNSFLLKKAGQNLDGYFTLQQPDEGQTMPAYGGPPALTSYEAELIRQWIITGAKQTGTQVDTSLIWDYYNGAGGQAFETPPPAPAPGTGFQVRFGPVFIPTLGNTGNEIELLKKEQLNLSADAEVTRIEADLNPQSHHFLLFMFDDSVSATAYDQGLRIVTIFNGATDGDKELEGAWQYDHGMDLPSGTAFYYDKRDVLDLNYHIKNYSATDILPADIYLNILTQPRGSGAKPMRAQMVTNTALFIFPGNNDETMEDTWQGNDDRQIWMISSHTHKYGTDFDIFIRDSTNGNRGPQIYEGFYNRDYTFNQGYYDWAHPAIRVFDTLLTVHDSEGLIFDTKWTNTSGNIVTFGLTTNDEMQLATYLYVNKNEVVPVGSTPQTLVDPYRYQVYPNPMNDHTTIDFGGVRRSGQWTMLDIHGKEVVQGKFRQSAEVAVTQEGLSPGVYMLHITFDNGNVLSHKLLVK